MTRIFLSAPDVGHRERELVTEAFDSGYIAPFGPMLDRFEREFADYVGASHAVAVSSGTAALHLALRLIDTKPGDVVIAPTLTFIGGVAPIVYENARPLFVDCDPQSWCLDADLLDQAFNLAKHAGARVAAVMPTDLYGQACDVDQIREICDAHGTPLIIDAAESVGALYKKRHAGLGGLCAAYSFNGNKIMTTSGGGMLVSEDSDLITRARYLATAARQPAPHYEHTEVGFNYRLSSLSAAVGIAQLETIERKVARRREIFHRYSSGLTGVPGLSFAPEVADRRHSRWLTVMRIDCKLAKVSPEVMRQALDHHDIEARPLWKPMHMQEVFRDSLRVGGHTAENLFASGLCLPSGSALTDADIDRVINAITETVIHA